MTRLSLSAGRDSVTSARSKEPASANMAEKRRIQDAGRAVGFADQPQPETGTVCRRGSGDRPRPARRTRLPVSLCDDRGNISWEWSDDPELQADDPLGNTARLSALAPKDLMIEDESNDLAAPNNDPLPPVRSRYRVTTRTTGASRPSSHGRRSATCASSASGSRSRSACEISPARASRGSGPLRRVAQL